MSVKLKLFFLSAAGEGPEAKTKIHMGLGRATTIAIKGEALARTQRVRRFDGCGSVVTKVLRLGANLTPPYGDCYGRCPRIYF
jgi:hypothetical protein